MSRQMDKSQMAQALLITVPPLTMSSIFALHVQSDAKEVMNIVSKCQLSSSNCQGVRMFQRFGGKASVTDLQNCPDCIGSVNYICYQCHFKGHHLPLKTWAPVSHIRDKGYCKTKQAVKHKIFLEINMFVINFSFS